MVQVNGPILDVFADFSEDHEGWNGGKAGHLFRPHSPPSDSRPATSVISYPKNSRQTGGSYPAVLLTYAQFVEQIYIFYIYIVLYLTLVGVESLKSGGGCGRRTRSDIILGRLRTGICTNMMVRTDHVWSCLILMIKVRSL